MPIDEISEPVFKKFQQFIFDQAGITLSAAKRKLVVGRLAKRLRHHGLNCYGDYFQQMISGQLGREELQLVVDQLTTNETHFFREQPHFDFLREQASALVGKGRSFRVWSAASSSGEEAYSTAMVLHDVLGKGAWDVFGSDINNEILSKARGGHYSMGSAHEIPERYLKRYCLKGVRGQAGTFIIDNEIKQHVRFSQVNLNASLPEIGQFDLIFLRNVMIYFSQQTKRSVVARMIPKLKPGGYFIVGHSESLNGVTDQLQQLRPTVYRKSAATQ